MSDLRSATSRANGANSHGPVTPEGKARAGRNGVKHGLRAATLVLPTEDQAEFDDLRLGFYSRFLPANVVEEALVDQLVAACWRMTRAQAFETTAIGHQIELQQPEVDAAYETIAPVVRAVIAFKTLTDSSTVLDACRRLDTSNFRRFERSLSLLRYLQKGRPSSSSGEECTTEPEPPWSNAVVVRESRPSSSSGQQSTPEQPEPQAGQPSPTSANPPAGASWSEPPACHDGIRAVVTPEGRPLASAREETTTEPAPPRESRPPLAAAPTNPDATPSPGISTHD